MSSIFARGLIYGTALSTAFALALATGPAQAGVSAVLVSNQIQASSILGSINYDYLNGQPVVNLSTSQTDFQGFSIDALSTMDSHNIDFKNGIVGVGYYTNVTVTTGVAITFTNDQSVAVRPVLQSTLLAAGIGVYLTPGLHAADFGETITPATCTSGQVKNCGEPSPTAAGNARVLGPVGSYGQSSAGFAFNVSVNGQSIYNLGGDVGINGGFYSDIGAAQAALSGFTRSSVSSDQYALGYSWDDTPVDIVLPDMLQPGDSVTAIYTVTTYADIAPTGSCLETNIGGENVGVCESAYAAFGDPVGRGGGIPNGTPTGGGMLLDSLFANPLFASPGIGGITNLNTDSIGQFSLPTAVYDPQTGQYIADLNGQTLPPGVPEPASWALMLSGFGLLGAALRHGRDRAPARVEQA